MQDPDHMKARCAKCHADPNEPCITVYGQIAEKVHYGRPYWSEVKINNKPYVLKLDNTELSLNLIEFKVLKDLRRPGICTECGDPYNQPGLLRRCQSGHQVST